MHGPGRCPVREFTDVYFVERLNIGQDNGENMKDMEFLKELKEYIEEVEELLEDDRGKGLSISELIKSGQMPHVYAEVLSRLGK